MPDKCKLVLGVGSPLLDILAPVEESFLAANIDGEKGGMMLSAPIVINGVPIASLALVGPKRIDYQQVASALKFIVGQIDNLKGDK